MSAAIGLGLTTRREAGVAKTRKPLYIFDLDGTLADASHRQHHLTCSPDADWEAFFAACDADTPILPVIETMQTLSLMAEVWIWTGRSDQVADLTLAWLNQHTTFRRPQLERIVRMRPGGDYRPDHVLKAEWLQGLPPADRRRLVAVFEDRASVVQMWRAAGVPCFQVAPGDF